MEDDPVDRLVGQWAGERPDLDLEAMAAIARLARLTARIGDSVEEVMARHGLKTGEFDVLAALRRAGPPYALAPTALARATMLSPAGMTNRIDRLEAAGLVARRPHPGDRRSFQVRLTDRGREVVDAAVTEHVANERRLLDLLGERDRAALDRAVRRWLRALEEAEAGDRPV